MAFYRLTEPGSRIEIPLEITHIPRFDPPTVRTVAGTVFLTVSDADMIESKIVALVNRHFTQARDILDVFLFQDRLPPDAAGRLWQKFGELPLSPTDVRERLNRLLAASSVHVREIERILDAQVAPVVAANLRVAGGAAMIWDRVVELLKDKLTIQEWKP
jgi:predicted nucleotidyltransferase component of viral defense system